MSESSSSRITYEHPLNERVRTLLRLEFLFDQGRFGMTGDTEWHSRLAVGTLVDIVALLSRGDLRSEIQKELEQMVTSLEALEKRPGVDPSLLAPVLDECRDLAQRLRAAPPGIPAIVRDNEFLAAVAQRSGIMGGTCAFDLPGYHLWLNRSPERRREDLESWYDGFGILRESTRRILSLLRESADPVTLEAEGGSYQRTLERGSPYQLLRVALPADAPYFPEISGNKHFCTVRFMVQGGATERPQQTDENVPFRLELCAI
ncbi:cell division protein ZapD [Arhodomonas aquaeolei]|uniref:cell division protein ZapD n=1 Tax=Arhodomonas aquaeolei TaxID=2369 RepID=UPI00037A984C|nr:cell division protein ZapD [Arhodomonas aquaeolei]